MHRHYSRVVFKCPINLKIVVNKNYAQYKGIKRPHVYHKDSYLTGRPIQLGSTISTLFRPTHLSHFIDNKYCSQQNVNSKSATGQKPEDFTPCNGPSQISTNSQEDPSNFSEDQENLFEDINFQEITGGDEEELNKFKLLMLEIDVLRQDGMNVPSKLSTEQWKELFALRSRSQRKKYLVFLFKNEMKRLSDKRKKELKRLEKERTQLEKVTEEDKENDHLQYGFRGSTIFLRIYDSTINFYDNYRLIRAMMFGQNLVVDCGFQNDMNTMENKLCCKQLVFLFAENRLGKDPFNLHFCNLKKDSVLYRQLKNNIPTIEDPTFPINIYEEHYLDLFPREKLVYLTPHCRTELKEYNHDDIYIIGAIVDKVNTQPLTLAKAKSEGLRMAQLPLDRYLDWSVGNKSLTINQVLKIMHDAQVTGDWNFALQHVPRRKIRHPDEPVRDPRKPSKRGTTFQPPQRFIKYY